MDKKKFKIQLHLLSERGDLFKEVDKSVKIFLPKFKFKFKFKHVLNFFVNFYRIKKTKPEIIHCFLPFAYLMGGVIGQDLNLRPSGYEPDELPGCSTPRQ